LFTFALIIFDILEKIPMPIPPNNFYFLLLFKYFFINIIASTNTPAKTKVLINELAGEPK
jgi:hypothetical protein